MDDDEAVIEFSTKNCKSKFLRFGNNEFVKYLQRYPVVMRKQTPGIRKLKLEALDKIEKKIKINHGIKMNVTQIKKKLHNMTTRTKIRREQLRAVNKEKHLKDYELKFLQLLDSKNQMTNVKSELYQDENLVDDESYEVEDDADTSIYQNQGQDYDQIDDAVSNTSFSSTSVPLPETPFPDIEIAEGSIEHSVSNAPSSARKPTVQKENSQMLKLQCEVLEQQKKLNVQQSEIFTLQKQQIRLQINVLKKQHINLSLEEAVLRTKINMMEKNKIDQIFIEENPLP